MSPCDKFLSSRSAFNRSPIAILKSSRVLPILTPASRKIKSQWSLGETPQDRGDLSDDFGVDPVSKSPRAERHARVQMYDEFVRVQSTTPAQIAAVSFEDQIERLIEERFPLSGSLDAPVNCDQAGAGEPGMDRHLIAPHPKDVRK